MIVAHFDQGWEGLRAADLQHAIVDAYCKPWALDDSKTVLVNNTWYYTNFDANGGFLGPSTAFEESINTYLLNNAVDHIVEYSLVDPAWNTPQYAVDVPVVKIGYYNTPHWIDFHAILVSENLHVDPAIAHNNITVPFMSLNGKPAPHRTELVTAIVKRSLHTQGLVSYSGEPHLKIEERDTRVHGINADPFDAMSLGDIANWNSHFLNIVTETIWDVENFSFWSEKTFKPIIGRRPFLIYTPDGAVNMLRKHGFEPYVDSFTDITDLDLTVPANIPDFLVTLSDQPTSYLQHKYAELTPQLDYNAARFYAHVEEQRAKIAQR